jgi:hypothetical protein
MLDLYAQTDMDELMAAQQLVLDAIFSPGPIGGRESGWIGNWMKTGRDGWAAAASR